MKTLKFTKMHGLGNDFMVVNAIEQDFDPLAAPLAQWADRYRGVGFDQFLVVEKPSSDAVDFRYRIFNADGREVEQCGNGARCFARFVADKGLTDKTEDALTHIVLVGLESVPVSCVNMGNPHAVILVDDVETAPVEHWGSTIESHEQFPERVNVGFLQVEDELSVRLRVFERGVGETQACGTGACAAVVAGVRNGLLKAGAPVRVTLPGGELFISWEEGGDVQMTGPAETVFEGELQYS